MIEPAWTKMRCLIACPRAISYAGPPGRRSAAASFWARAPPAQSNCSGSSTQSGLSSATARSISASAAAILAALSLIEFICMSETFMTPPLRGACSRSATRSAAVDRKRDAGDHRSSVSKQKYDRGGDLFLRRPAAQRHPPEKRVGDFGLAPVGRRHLRHHNGWIHAVHANIVLAQFERGNPGDVVQRRLGRPVRNVAGKADERRLARHVDDGAPFAKTDHGP